MKDFIFQSARFLPLRSCNRNSVNRSGKNSRCLKERNGHKMKLSELVLKSRSYRSFLPGGRIPHDKLVDFADTARYCPSSINMQVLKYRITDEPEECASLLSCLRFARLLDIPLPPEGHGPAAYITVCHDTAISENMPRFDRDVGIVAQTIMLAAAEAGYGGCMVGAFDAAEVSAVLRLPDGISPRLVLALGIPDETVVITDSIPGNADSVRYFRTGGLHCVPKRPLEEVLIANDGSRKDDGSDGE